MPPLGLNDDNEIVRILPDGSECLYADVAKGGCALRETADSPPPTAVQYREMLAALKETEEENDTYCRTVDRLAAEIERLRGALRAWVKWAEGSESLTKPDHDNLGFLEALTLARSALDTDQPPRGDEHG